MQAYFFTMFLSVGMVNAYAGIWFAERGLTESQIGLIGALPILLLLGTTLYFGRLADRARDWRQVIALGAVFAALIPIGLFWATGFWSILLVWTALSVAQRLVVPVADGAGIRMARRLGRDFGGLRALSTTGYLIVVVTAGYALGAERLHLFLPLFVVLSMVRAGAALALPPMRGEGPRAAPATTGFAQMWKPWFVLPVLCWAMIDATNHILNNFQGLLWSQQGIATPTIGLLITWGALAEAAMFVAYHRFSPRLGARALLLVTALLAALRWAGMAMEPGVGWLFALQTLHSVTYALGFLACTSFIADHTAEDHAAEAQSFLALVGMIVSAGAVMVFGWLAGPFGAGAYYFSMCLALVGAAAVIASRRLRPPPHLTENTSG